MPTALWWKQFYANERHALGKDYLDELIRAAPSVEIPRHGALIFPHTRLSEAGYIPAIAARAVIESGADTVLALGVLHGARERDAEIVRRAKAGDAHAIRFLRGIHGPNVKEDTGLWAEEFSLDNFQVLVKQASLMFDVKMPNVIARYPFFTGTEPDTMPGFTELQSLLLQGAALVVTADIIHHGVAYDTPTEQRRLANDDTHAWAQQSISSLLETLSRHDYAEFQSECDALKADFRHSAPIMAALLEDAFSSNILHCALISYAKQLDEDEPTWVAAALVQILS